MMTKFDQELYARIKAKKIECLSCIGQWRVRVIEKKKEKEVTEKGSSTLSQRKVELPPRLLLLRRSLLVRRSARQGIRGRRRLEPVFGLTSGRL